MPEESSPIREPRQGGVRAWARRWSLVRRDGPGTLEVSLERVAIFLAVLLATTGLFAALSAASGLFRIAAPILWLSWALVLVLVAVLAFRRRLVWRGDRFDLVAFGISLLSAVLSGALHHHYYVAQSDIGFYISDAAITAQTGGRVINGPHDTLLPGFADAPGGFRVSAMFGYSSLAALFSYIGGPFAAPFVNMPLSFVTLLSLYLVARHLGARSGAVFATSFYALSLPTLWFHRWVMTENAATFVFWSAALLVIPLRRRWEPRRLLALLPILAYGALVRAEGILIAAWVLGIVLAIGRHRWLPAIRNLWSDPTQRVMRNRILAASAAGVAVVSLLLVALRRSLPLAYLEANFALAGQLLQGRPAADAPDVMMSGPHPNWGDYALRFEWDSFREYYLHWFLLVAAIALAMRLVGWRRAALLLLLAMPYVGFILMPPVTTAHPWYMRRLWIAIVPLVYLMAGVSLDVIRAGLHWPLRVKGRAQLRIAPMFVAVALVVIMLVLQLDVAGSVALRREQDGVRPLLAQVLRDVPEGAVILVDEDVVGVATMLRLHHGPTVIPWFNQRYVSMEHSLAASDAAGRTFLLRLNTTAPTTLLLTDPDGVVGSAEYVQTTQTPVRAEYRSYIALAPLDKGYQPLQTYLDRAVPPNQWRTNHNRVVLEEMRSPLVLVKNLEIAPNEWQRTDRGLVASKDNSTLTINRTMFLPDYLERVQLYVYLTYVQDTNQTRYATAVGGDGARLETPLPSDGSGALRQIRVPLPMPMNLDGVSLPNGFTLRGALFAIQ